MKLLLVNSNSTEAVTDRMVAVARTVAAPKTTITGLTAAGTPVIRTHWEFATAAVETVVALKAQAHDHDAAIIGCFGDPGLKAARHELSIPVVGMAEAAMLSAHLLGGSYSIVTFGPHNAVTIADLARHYGLHTRLASVRIAPVSHAAMLADPTQAITACRTAGQQALDHDGADVLILGGGPVTGMASQIAAELGVPVLDGIACATKLAESLVACGYTTTRRGLYHPG
ncbi:aspartate/glutamate racemase family protein [Leptolyngbya sp. BL0902]|uniref:aspartate/glutamate racemase family protein n=1 Tax=Leptolyngbya sp. BL0902 TaxID=1115757 RepID=UPI0018E753E9|nr:aspartate/glutamate racemase family protein [Leptolyngbya sp. BL0902]